MIGLVRLQGAGRRRACSLAILLFVVIAGRLLFGEALDEEQMKAAFLYNFAKFVEWPAGALPSSKDPIVCCILGESPFTGALLRAANGRPIEEHAFVVRKIADARHAAGCHLLFVSASERRGPRRVLAELGPGAILTIGEAEDFIGEGGIANFKLDRGRIRIQINPKAAERQGLRISPKLLSIGEIVGN